MSLDKSKKINIDEILSNLKDYRPKRKGWTWRKTLDKKQKIGSYEFENVSEN